MNKEDKVDLIAAIIAAGMADSGERTSASVAISHFRVIRR